MGAALTYARRYALFTLVGIAGEDDLDAPDLPVNPIDSGAAGRSDPKRMNGGANAAAADPVVGHAMRRNQRPSKPVLEANESGPVRDRLVNEIAALDAAETAIEWAGQNLGAKNTLTAEDAAIVEAAFRDADAGAGTRSPSGGLRRRHSCRPLPQRRGHNPHRKVLRIH